MTLHARDASSEPLHPPGASFSIRTVATAALLCWVGLLSPSASAETTEEVLAQHRKALGGDAALAKTTAVVQKGTLEHMGVTRSFMWSTMRPMFFREDSVGTGIQETIASDGKTAWNRAFNGVVYGVSGADRTAAHLTGLLLTRAYLAPDDHDLEAGEAKRSDGDRTWTVPFSGRHLPPFELSFDAKTWQLTRATCKDSRGRLELTFEDVRKEGDLRFPFKVVRTMVRDGVNDVTAFTVKNIDRKPTLEESAFERPMETGGRFRLPEGQSTVSVPLQFNASTHHILVQASIQDSPPAWFLLDSAAHATVLDKGWMAPLNLPVVDRVIASGAGGSQMLELHGVERIRIGGLELGSTVVASSDLSALSQAFQQPVAGILGMEVFDRVVVELKYADGKVLFHAPAAFADRGTGEALPIDDLGRVNTLINGKTLLSVMFDTGSGGAINLAPATVLREGLAPPPERRLGTVVSGVGGQTAAFQGLLESVQLGQLTIPAVVAIFHEGEAGALAGDDGISVIGNQLLQRFTVTFDFPRRQVLLEPGPWFSKPFPYNRSGLKLKPGAEMIVETIRGAPDPAGIQVGDQVVSVMTEKGWTPERTTVEGRFREAAGTKLKVKIQRGKKELEREIVLKELL